MKCGEECAGGKESAVGEGAGDVETYSGDVGDVVETAGGCYNEQ